MTPSLDREALAKWRDDVLALASGRLGMGGHPARTIPLAALTALDDAIRALVEAKVREAVTLARAQERRGGWTDDDAIVANVMGDNK